MSALKTPGFWTAWLHHWPFSLMQIGALLYILWSFRKNPLPGYSVALLALLAAAMSIHAEANGSQKAIWMLLIALCLFAEFRAIRVDRESTERETQRVRREEAGRFETIVRNLQESIANSQKQFDKTIARTNQVLDNVTGGRSYAVVFPEMFGQNSEFPLLIENRGENVLTGVTVTITQSGAYSGRVPQFILDAVDKRAIVGTIGPEERHWMNTRLLIKNLAEFDENGEHIHRAFVLIYAQNFSVTEYLDFKQVDGRWLFRYASYRNLTKKERKLIGDSKGKYKPSTKLEAIDWTEDFNRSAPRG